MIKKTLLSLYGLYVSIAYLFLQHIGVTKGLSLLLFSTIIVFVILFSFSKFAISSLFDIRILSRGILFGIIQILIIESQAYLSTSSIFAFLLFGNTVLIYGHSFRKNQQFSLGQKISILIISVSGIFISNEYNNIYLLLPLLAGVLQASMIILTIEIKVRDNSNLDILKGTLLYSSIVFFVYLIIKNEKLPVLELNYNFLVVCVLLVAIQLLYLEIAKTFNKTQNFAIFISRSIWAFIIEVIILSKVFTVYYSVGISLLALYCFLQISEKINVSED